MSKGHGLARGGAVCGAGPGHRRQPRGGPLRGGGLGRLRHVAHAQAGRARGADASAEVLDKSRARRARPAWLARAPGVSARGARSGLLYMGAAGGQRTR